MRDCKKDRNDVFFHFLLLFCFTLFFVVDSSLLPPPLLHRATAVHRELPPQSLLLLLLRSHPRGPLQRLPHIERVLAVGVVLVLDAFNVVAQRLGIQVERRAVADADVQGSVPGPEHLGHGGVRGVHQARREAEAAVRARDGERRDVAVHLGAGARGVRSVGARAGGRGGRCLLVLDLGKDVANDVAVGGLGDLEELRPREDVVVVVLECFFCVWKEKEGVGGERGEDDDAERRLETSSRLEQSLP